MPDTTELRAALEVLDKRIRAIEDDRVRIVILSAYYEFCRTLMPHLGGAGRRVLRSLHGQPFSRSGATQSSEQWEKQKAEEAAWNRIRREYSGEAQQEIQDLMSKLWRNRPGVPYLRALAWAEKTYLEGH